MSPRSRGRKPKKSGSSERTSKRRSPAAGRATAVDPGYSGLSIELPRSPLDDVLTPHVRPDRFGPSHRRVLTASVVLLRAGGPRALEQATAELIGAELRNPEVQGLRFDLWAHDLIESARNRVLSWDNGTWQGPWWLLRGLASIGSYGLGGHAAQQAAEAAKSLPRAALAQQPDWLALMPDIEATGDMHVLREALAEEWLGSMLPGTEHAVSPRRSAAFRDQITSWWDDQDAAGALSLLPEWIRWNGEQAGLPPDLISDAVALAGTSRSTRPSSGPSGTHCHR